MGYLLDGGDLIKIENKCFAFGQGGFCDVQIQKSTKFKSRGFKK